MKFSYPRMPPFALVLNPNPTRKKVNEEVASTKIVLSKITLFPYILMEPVSFIMNPTYARIMVTDTNTVQTVSKILPS